MQFFPSATALENEWLNNMQRLEKSSRQDIVDLLLRDLSRVTPAAFYDLLGLQFHQIFKKRLLDRFYPSVLVFVWQKSLEIFQPALADNLSRLFEMSFSARMPKAKPRLETIGRHLALFSVITDNYTEEGFLSVAHHIVWRVLGEIEKTPNNLISSVRLADYLDARFETYANQLRGREIKR